LVIVSAEWIVLMGTHAAEVTVRSRTKSRILQRSTQVHFAHGGCTVTVGLKV